MASFTGSRTPRITVTGEGRNAFVDYKNVDELRRLMTPNGKIYSRKRSGANGGVPRRDVPRRQHDRDRRPLRRRRRAVLYFQGGGAASTG